MNERIEALRGRLPYDVLSKVRMYDCHPTADLMKGVKMVRFNRERFVPPSLKCTVQAPAYFKYKDLWWYPPCMHLTDRTFYFMRWQYETCEDMIYIADWVAEEFLEERVAAWLDR